MSTKHLCDKMVSAAGNASVKHTVSKVAQGDFAGAAVTVGGSAAGTALGMCAAGALVTATGVAVAAFPPLAPLAIHVVHLAPTLAFGGMALGAETGHNLLKK
jgi:hypothetical protein